jgi:hypothetical protein
MAKMEKGFFGGFRGKIANVVGYSRWGKQFIRKRPVTTYNFPQPV